jgi:hypothetical protein
MIRVRADNSYNWDVNDPVLAVGEMGINTDVNSIKIGDGLHTWSSLSYINSATDVSNEIDCGFEG